MARLIKRNYVKKKLNYHHIIAVMSTDKAMKYGSMMRGLRAPFVIDGVPDGHFVPVEGGILLPKRKRGEKFHVKYTTVQETIL